MKANYPAFPEDASPICLGTGSYGSTVPPEDACKLLDLYFENGGNFLDSAHVYAAWIEGGEGASERTLGRWIRSNRLEKKILLATKGGHRPLNGDTRTGNLDRKMLDLQLNESLERLGLDYVPLYWLHRDDPSRPVGEILTTLHDFQRDGRIGAIGASNWTTKRIAEANAYAREHNISGFVASQPKWNAACHDGTRQPNKNGMILMGEKDQSWHQHSKVAVVPYSSQAQGYFGSENVQWAQSGFKGDPPLAAKYDAPESRRRLKEAMALGKAKNATPNQIALAALMAHPFAVFPIIGTQNPDHLREALDAAQIHLQEDERRRIFRSSQEGE